MLKPTLYSFFTLCCCSFLYAQETAPVRYRDQVFKNFLVSKNISYAGVADPAIKKDYYLFDFFEGEGDTVLKRPLIIWVHGGGFKYGTKRSAGTPRWSRDFARKGYVCAAINYRLSKKRPLAKFPDLVEGCSDAVDDVKMAVDYFRKNAAKYRIDPNRIILGGNSAGGMIALQAVYSSSAEMADLIHMPLTNSGKLAYHSIPIAAIINFWGALFDTSWLKNDRTPIVSVHGSKDHIVRADYKPGVPLYGSIAVHRAADALGIRNNLKIYQGYGHELQKHFNPLWSGGKTKKRWREAGNFAAAFLYEQFFKNGG